MSVIVAPAVGQDVPPVPVRRFTVDEYHKLIDVGFFAYDERFELLEGWIVPKMTRYPPHDQTLDNIHDMVWPLLPDGWRLRIQEAIVTPDSEPEPDGAVVRNSPRRYATRHPGPEDFGVLIEASDSTLQQDRTLKGRLYARANIPIYWIINLVDRQVEVYTDPTGPVADARYRQRRDYGPDEMVPLVLDGQEVGRIAVRDLLP
jgi:Uma2 family endonuclease